MFRKFYAEEISLYLFIFFFFGDLDEYQGF